MLKENEAADAKSGLPSDRRNGPSKAQEGSGLKRRLDGGQRGSRGGGRGGGRKGEGRPLGLRAARRQREQAEAEDFAAEYRMLRKAKKGRVSEAALDKVLGVELDDLEEGSVSEGE